MSACYKIFICYFMGKMLLRARNAVTQLFERKKAKMLRILSGSDLFVNGMSQ